jgi:sugar phosphate isomerase/epimerase
MGVSTLVLSRRGGSLDVRTADAVYSGVRTRARVEPGLYTIEHRGVLMLSRRSFLVSAGAGIAAGSVMGCAIAAHHGRKVTPGIQLWTVKNEAAKDLEGTLRKVYEAGFREIEFAGYYGRTAPEFVPLLKSIGFTLVSTHAGAGDIARMGDKIIADAKSFGLEYVICSSPMPLPEKQKLTWSEQMAAINLDDWKINVDLFNDFGKKVTAAGMVFGYHNHDAEFKKYGGKSAFDYLFENTDPEHVKIQLDVGWVTVAQEDPIAILNKYKGRVVSLHVKDVAARGADGKPPTSVALGEGVTDWKKVLGVAHAHGVKHYFYEQEEPFTRPILDSVKMSGDYLKKLEI